MGRKRRIWISHAYHHIYARGNNRQNIFHDEIDMIEAFRLLAMIHCDYPISVCAYCIMTNHYHLLLKSEKISISKIMCIFNKRYTDYYNRKYIHRNPIITKKSMVTNMEDYHFSSYQLYKKI